MFCSRYDHHTKKTQTAGDFIPRVFTSAACVFTQTVVQVSTTDVVVCMYFDLVSGSLASTGSNQAYWTISTSQLNTLLRLHLWPIDEVVYLGPQGYLVLRGASRLDAFSGYPVRS